MDFSVSANLGAKDQQNCLFKTPKSSLPKFRSVTQSAIDPAEKMSIETTGPIPEPRRSEPAQWIPSWHREALADLGSRKEEIAERSKVYSQLLEDYLSMRDALVVKKRNLKILKQDLKFRCRLIKVLKDFLREELSGEKDEKEQAGEEEEAEEAPEI